MTDSSEPAFPHPGGAGDFTIQKSHLGMTLRDYFAGQALAGMMERWGQSTIPDCRDIAKFSYIMADAMLAQRSPVVVSSTPVPSDKLGGES